ncbi:unnamed protein product, partial [Timema podura]|nr:unnamed protein product [Timema podura]
AAVLKKTAAPPGVRARVETPPQAKGPSSTIDSGLLSDSEGEGGKKSIITRKLTRSTSARRSKHLIGKTSDTESDTESKRSSSKSPVKKVNPGPKGPSQRKGKNRGGGGINDLSQVPIVEERRCPIDGCDSQGHLGGRLDKHFTIEACPLYHNMSIQECKVSHHQ